ncbi:MAG TPA: AbrB/MazE/SpoVT family DNA-binding domain-containing protein [Terracidiphilus sp.]|jgi:antitoxin PrlF
MPLTSHNPSTTVEATVTSKGQVTLPGELRKRLGIQKGSRIRFNIPASGPVEVERVLYDLEDLWRMADAGPKSERVMSFEEMNAAKARRRW